jgi:flagellar basal-body rod protein FlgG
MLSAYGAPHLAASTDFAAGPLRLTGNPFDLAISGQGYFRVQGEDGAYYTRAGQFTRDDRGRLIDAQGLALQTVDAHDLVLGSGRIEVTDDGTVLEDGAPIARIGLFQLREGSDLERVGGAYFAASAEAMEDAAAPAIRQGMIEGSNVELASEMLVMMGALREAEAGARVVQAYDALIGQSITTLGRTSA